MRDLRTFTLSGYDKGRPRAVQAVWFAVQNLVFAAWWCPASLRVALLRAFGARVGEGVLIRHRVRVLWPWKLTIGDHAWIGEGAWILDLEPVTIGAHACVSQEAMLCTGSHDHTRADFAYRNAPIVVGDGAWVAARAIVLPGVVVGDEAVVAAGVTVHKDVPPRTVRTARGDRPVVPAGAPAASTAASTAQGAPAAGPPAGQAPTTERARP